MSNRNSEVVRNVSWSQRLAVIAFGSELFLRFLVSLISPFGSFGFPNCFPLNELMGLDVRLGILTITSMQWNNLSLTFRLLNDWRISLEIQGLRLESILTEKSNDSTETVAAAALSTENMVIPTTTTAASDNKTYLSRFLHWGTMMLLNLAPFITISLNNCIISMSVIDETIECRFESCQLRTCRTVGGATQPSNFGIGHMDLQLTAEKLAVDVVHSSTDRHGMVDEDLGSISSSILTISKLQVSYTPNERSRPVIDDIPLHAAGSNVRHEVNGLYSRRNQRRIGIDVVCGDVAFTADETLRLSTVTVARSLYQRLTCTHSSLLATFRRRFDNLAGLVDEFMNQLPNAAGIAIDTNHRSVEVLAGENNDASSGPLSLWGEEKDKKSLRVNFTARSVQLLSVADAAKFVTDSDNMRSGLTPAIPSSSATTPTTVLSMRDLTLTANDIFSDDMVAADATVGDGVGIRRQDLHVTLGGLSGSDVTFVDLMSGGNGSSSDGVAIMDWQYSAIYDAHENNHNRSAATAASERSGRLPRHCSVRKRLSLAGNVKPFQVTLEATALAPVVALASGLGAIVKAAVATSSLFSASVLRSEDHTNSRPRPSSGALVTVIDNVFEDFRIACGDFQIMVKLPSTIARTSFNSASDSCSSSSSNSDADHSDMLERALVCRVAGVEGYCDESRTSVSSSSSSSVGERGKCLVLAIASITIDHVARSTNGSRHSDNSIGGRVAAVANREETLTMVQMSEFLAAAALSTATAPAGGWMPLPPPPPPSPPSSGSATNNDHVVSEEADVHAWKAWLQCRTCRQPATSTPSSSSSTSATSTTDATTSVGDDSDDVTTPRSFLDIDCTMQLLALSLDSTIATSMGMLAGLLVPAPVSFVPRAAVPASSPIVPISLGMLEGSGCRVNVHVTSFEGKLLVPVDGAAAAGATEDGEMFILRCQQRPQTVLLRPPSGGFRVEALGVPGVAHACDVMMDSGLSLVHMAKASFSLSTNGGTGSNATVSTVICEFGSVTENSPSPAGLGPCPSMQIYSHTCYPVNTFLVPSLPPHGNNRRHDTTTNRSSRIGSTGICVMRSVRSVGADRLMICLDAIDVDKFIRPLAAYTIGRRSINSNDHRGTSVSSSVSADSRTGPQPVPRADDNAVAVWKAPTAIYSLHIQTVSVRLTHDKKAVMALGAKELEAYHVNFADRLTQYCGSLKSLECTDMTHADALHRHVIRDIDGDFRPSVLEFHCTLLRGQKPLLEINLDQTRVLYLQRSTMTFVSFFRDHFLPTANRSWKRRESNNNTNNNDSNGNDGPLGVFRLCVTLSRFEFHLPLSSSGSDALCLLVPDARLYSYHEDIASLLDASMSNPVNSRLSTESDVVNNESNDYEDVMFSETVGEDDGQEGDDNTIYVDAHMTPGASRSTPLTSPAKSSSYLDLNTMTANTLGLHYLRGPFVSSGARLSELINVRVALNRDRRLRRSLMHWSLPSLVNGEMNARLHYRQRNESLESADENDDLSHVPSDGSIILRPPMGVGLATNDRPFSLRLEIPGATICSWCNQNVVGEDLCALVQLSIQRTTPVAAGMYAEVLGPAGLDFSLPSSEQRNTTIVDVRIENNALELSLAQGQYMAIVHLIQQNFPEIQVVVPDIFPLPIPTTVHLQEHVYGHNAMESRLPLMSTVPVHIPCVGSSDRGQGKGRGGGRIVAYENTLEYYDLFERTMKDAEMDEPLSAERPSASSTLPFSTSSSSSSSYQTTSAITTTATGGNPSKSSSTSTRALPRLLTFDDVIVDRIPLWSYHHTHREKLFARAAATTTNATTSYDDDDDDDDVDDDATAKCGIHVFESKQSRSLHVDVLSRVSLCSEQFAGSSLVHIYPGSSTSSGLNDSMKSSATPPISVDTTGRTLRPSFRVVRKAGFPELGVVVLAVHFTELELDFYRRHYGGGNGIEVSAQSFVVTKGDAPIRTRHGNIVHRSHSHRLSSPSYTSSSSRGGRQRRMPGDSRERRNPNDEADKGLGGLDDSDSSGGSLDGSAGRFGAGGLGVTSVPPEFVIFAPKTLPQMNKVTAMGMMSGSSTMDAMSPGSPLSPRIPTSRPHIRYSQQGVGNLRRCVVNISDSLLVVHFQAIMALVTYFVEPVHLSARRAHAVVTHKEQRQLDFKAALDVEVHLKNTVICVPHRTTGSAGSHPMASSPGIGATRSEHADGGSGRHPGVARRDIKSSNSSAGGHRRSGGLGLGRHSTSGPSSVMSMSVASHGQPMSALCITADVDYTHAFRGFLRAGPGKITVEVELSVRSMFIAPIHQVQTVGSESLIAPCCAHVVMELMILPERQHLHANLAQLSPWVEFSPWVLKPFSSSMSGTGTGTGAGVGTDHPPSANSVPLVQAPVTAMRIVSFCLAPVSHSNTATANAPHHDHDADSDSYGTGVYERDVDSFEGGDGWDAPGYLHKFGSDVYDENHHPKHGRGRPSQSTPRDRHSNRATKNDDDDSDDDEGKSSHPRFDTLQLRLSLKDVAFIHAAIQQLGWSQAADAESRRMRPTIDERFQYFFETFRDIDNVPLLSELLVHVPLATMMSSASSSGTASAESELQSELHQSQQRVPGLVVGVTDILSDVSDIRITLRNNTYNVDIARLDVRELRFSYHRSQPSAGAEDSHLHMAAGVRLSAWAHNEALDVWEPMVEPFSVTAIAATDSTESQVHAPHQRDMSTTHTPTHIPAFPTTDGGELSSPQPAMGPTEGSGDGDEMKDRTDGQDEVGGIPRDAKAAAGSLDPANPTSATSFDRASNIEPSTLHAPTNAHSSAVAVNVVSQQRVRFDVYSEPIEINAAQGSVVGLIRKLSLADVVTSSSVDLPPYRVINDLGVPVTCSISSGGAVVTLDEIPVGAQLPIEVHHLADAAAAGISGAVGLSRKGPQPHPLNRSSGGRTLRAPRSVQLQSMSREHLLSISFTVLADTFDAIEAVPLDREICHAFKMRLVRSDRKVYNVEARNSLVVVSKKDNTLPEKFLVAAAMAGVDALGSAGAVSNKTSAPSASPHDALAYAVASATSQAVLGRGLGGTGLAAAIGGLSQLQQQAQASASAATASVLAAATASTNTSPKKVNALSSFFKATPSTYQRPSPSAKRPEVVETPTRPTATTQNHHSTSATAAAKTKNTDRDDNIPLALVSMRIKPNGGRELVLRSVVSLKNDTGRVFQLSVRRSGVYDGAPLSSVSVEHTLLPGMEWNVPVQVAHPKASLFMRLDERAAWFEVLRSFDHLVVQGKWGAPTRLRADLCSCPGMQGLGLDPTNATPLWSSPSPSPASSSSSWVVLLKPEVIRGTKGGKSDGSSIASGRSFVSVRYPTKDSFRWSSSASGSKGGLGGGGGGGIGNDNDLGNVNFDEIYNLTFNKGAYEQGLAQPMCIHLLAPLQLCNVVAQPLLYRLANKEGLVTSEGIILPGEIVDIHSLSQLFAGKLYISVRVLNYCWSKWVKVFTRSSPYPASERVAEVVLSSMEMVYQSSDLSLPPLGLSLSMREHFIRIACPVLISNRTGLQLDFCEALDAAAARAAAATMKMGCEETMSVFVPHSSRASVDMLINSRLNPVPAKPTALTHRRVVRKPSAATAINTARRPSTTSTTPSTSANHLPIKSSDAPGTVVQGSLSVATDREGGQGSRRGRDFRPSQGKTSQSNARARKVRAVATTLTSEEVDQLTGVNAEGSDKQGQGGLDDDDEEDHEDNEGEEDEDSLHDDNDVDQVEENEEDEEEGLEEDEEREDVGLGFDEVSDHSSDDDAGMAASSQGIVDDLTSIYPSVGTATTMASGGPSGLWLDSSSPPPPPAVEMKIVNLAVHLPMDHFREVGVVASSRWTLADVFATVAASTKLHGGSSHSHGDTRQGLVGGARHALASPGTTPSPDPQHHINQQQSSYVFLYWDKGRLGPQTVDYSPAVEQDVFGSLGVGNMSAPSTQAGASDSAYPPIGLSPGPSDRATLSSSQPPPHRGATDTSVLAGSTSSGGTSPAPISIAEIGSRLTPPPNSNRTSFTKSISGFFKSSKAKFAEMAASSSSSPSSSSMSLSSATVTATTASSIGGIAAAAAGTAGSFPPRPSSTPFPSSSSSGNMATAGGGKGSGGPLLPQNIPPTMQYNMIADCALVPLPMNTPVHALTQSRLRLCHIAEWHIYRQSQAIKPEMVTKSKDGTATAFLSMFTRQKYTFKSFFMKFDGDIPFNPQRALLGFTPALSLRVSTESADTWSEGIDLLTSPARSSFVGSASSSGGSGDVGAAGTTEKGSSNSLSEHVSVSVGGSTGPGSGGSSHGAYSNMAGSSIGGGYGGGYGMSSLPFLAPSRHFEFGASVERGSGIMQGVTSVSIVPKYVLVSNLSFPLEIRQLLDWSIVARATAAITGASGGFGMGSDMGGGKAAMVYSNLFEYFEQTMVASIVSLAPGSVQNYHFPVRGRSDGMLLQIRCKQPTSESSDRGGPSSASATGKTGAAKVGGVGGGRRSSKSDKGSGTHTDSEGYVVDREKSSGGCQQASAPWFGEVDITTLGVVYAKLRVPKLHLIKVQVEMVGASLTATFSEQSVRWPPYRIDNLTSLTVRFRQQLVSQGEGAAVAVASSVSVNSSSISHSPTTAATANTAGAMSASGARHVAEAADATGSVTVSSSSSFDTKAAAAAAAKTDTSSAEGFSDGNHPHQPTGDDEDEAIPVAMAEAVSAEPFTGYGVVGGAPVHLQGSAGGVLGGEPVIPWDVVPSRSSSIYTWDFPRCVNVAGSTLGMAAGASSSSMSSSSSQSSGTGGSSQGMEKCIRVEFLQGEEGQSAGAGSKEHWVGLEINLDELAVEKMMDLQRSLPSLADALAEGFLLYREGGRGAGGGHYQQAWRTVYCVLNAAVLYVFKDASRRELVEVLSLCWPCEADTGLVELASVRGFTETGSWDLIGTMGMSFNLFGHAPGGHMSATQAGTGRAGGRGAVGAPHAMDVNRTRILLLHLAEFLGLLPRTLMGGIEDKNKGTSFPIASNTAAATAATPLTLRELLLSGWTVDQLLQHVCDSRIPVRRSDLIDAAIAIGEAHGHMAARALCDRLLAQEALILLPTVTIDLPRSSCHTQQRQQQPPLETQSQSARHDVKAVLDTDRVRGGRMSLVGGDYFADSIDDSDCDGVSDDDEHDDDDVKGEDNEGEEGWKTEPGLAVNATGGMGREVGGSRGVARSNNEATSSSLSSRQLPMTHASSVPSSSRVPEMVQTEDTQPRYLLQAPSLLAADEQGPGQAPAMQSGTTGNLGRGGVGKMHRREVSGGAGTGAVRGFTIFLPNTSHQFKSPPPQHPQYIQQLHESRERKKKTSPSSSLPSSTSTSSLRDLTSVEMALQEEIGPGPWLRSWIRSCRQSIEQAWVAAESGRGIGTDDAGGAAARGNTGTTSASSTNTNTGSSSFVVNGRISFNSPAAAAAAAAMNELAPAPAVTMQSFKVKVQLRTRADGPTKVLELLEVIEEDDLREEEGVSEGQGVVGDKSGGPSAILPNSNTMATAANTIPSASGGVGSGASALGGSTALSTKKRNPLLLRLEKAYSSLYHNSEANAAARARAGRGPSVEHIVSISVKLESVAVSVIDSEPAEVGYVRLEDIEVSIERTRALISTAATVQLVQISNQLLDPVFQVMLFPRQRKQQHRHPSSSQTLPPHATERSERAGYGRHRSGTVSTEQPLRLMLPGLHQKGDTFPALHLYFQQKYHQFSRFSSSAGYVGADNGPAAVSSDGNNNDGGNYDNSGSGEGSDANNLLYFDIVTVWLAPTELDVDEEAFLRMLRYVQDVRSHWQRAAGGRGLAASESNSTIAVRAELQALQQAGNRSWGLVEPHEVAHALSSLLLSGKRAYAEYLPLGSSLRRRSLLGGFSRNIYFSLLQLHPLDVVMTFRPSPNFLSDATSAEIAILSLVAQLDSARLCLNALLAEHVFGSRAVILDILAKHYRASLWKQFHKLVGSSDIVEGSVGLVANLGSGVYDLFYEPIDGLLSDESGGVNVGSFLTGLSRGGRSLASRAIGSTSAFTSKITGGLGKGVSLLTMDPAFYRSRTTRKFTKANSVSEGVYMGTKELGKSIVEGVSGIVVLPYRGWEAGGGVGLATGMARGLLGVALKPAVGVFDLVSRGTEGLRNTAFGGGDRLLGDRTHIARSRIPRAFGRGGVLLPYCLEAAAAQYVADTLCGFVRKERMWIALHLHIDRKVPLPMLSAATVASAVPPGPDSSPSPRDDDDPPSPTALSPPPSPPTRPNAWPPSSWYPEQREMTERWGMATGESYLCLIAEGRVLLTHITSLARQPAHDTANDGGAHVAPRFDVSLVWSCPVSCIDQLCSDTNGDLVITVNTALAPVGKVTSPLSTLQCPWNHPSVPVVCDPLMQDHVTLQSLLEQTIGVARARLHPLHPSLPPMGGGASILHGESPFATTTAGTTAAASAAISTAAERTGATREEEEMKGGHPHGPAKTTRPLPAQIPQAAPSPDPANTSPGGGTSVCVCPCAAYQSEVLKRYSTGLKSVMFKPTKHAIQLFGNCLYEYNTPATATSASKKVYTAAAAALSGLKKAGAVGSAAPSSGRHATPASSSHHPHPSTHPPHRTTTGSHNNTSTSSGSGDSGGAGGVPGLTKKAKPNTHSDEKMARLIGGLFGKRGNNSHHPHASGAGVHAASSNNHSNHVLGYLYPLVEVVVTGPHVEEGGAAAAAGLGGMVSSGGKHSLSIGRRDGRSMRVLKRDDESGRLIEHHKSMLTLIFADRATAQAWRERIEQRVLASPGLPVDVLSHAGGQGLGPIGASSVQQPPQQQQQQQHNQQLQQQHQQDSQRRHSNISMSHIIDSDSDEDDDDDDDDDDGSDSEIATEMSSASRDHHQHHATPIDRKPGALTATRSMSSLSSIAKKLGLGTSSSNNSNNNSSSSGSGSMNTGTMMTMTVAHGSSIITTSNSGSGSSSSSTGAAATVGMMMMGSGGGRSWSDGPLGQEPHDPRSVQGTLVIPTAGLSPRDAERLKIEIARTMSSAAAMAGMRQQSSSSSGHSK